MQLIEILFFKQITASLKYRSLKVVIIYIDLPGMSFSMDTAFLHSWTAWNGLGIVEIVWFFLVSRSKTKKMNRQQTRARITKRTSVLRFFCSTRRRTDSFLNVIPRNNVVEEDTRDENARSYVVINRSATALMPFELNRDEETRNCQLSDSFVPSFNRSFGSTWHDHIPWTRLTLREIRQNGRSSNKIQHPTLCHHNILGTVTNRITNDHWSNGVTWSVGWSTSSMEIFQRVHSVSGEQHQQEQIKKKKKKNKCHRTTIFQSWSHKFK